MRLFLVALILLTGVAGFFIFFRKPQNVTKPPIIATQNSNTVEVSDASENAVKDVHSPDGKMNLKMEKVQGDVETIYNFYVSEIEGANETLLFSKAQNNEKIMDLSPNSFSPDNKYVFIEEKGKNGSDFFVFRANGEAMTDEVEYIDVKSIFESKDTGNIFDRVTGWDSPTLLHIFTKNESGAQSTSYWFEIPSGWTSGLNHR